MLNENTSAEGVAKTDMPKQNTNMRVITVRGLILALVGILMSLSLATTINQKQVLGLPSDELNFQARLLTASGAIVPDGDYHVEFKIYDAVTSTGSSQGTCTGDSNCLWVETRSTGSLVTVKNGYLSVYLGSVNNLPSNINWSEQLWLTMNIGGDGGSAAWDGEMTPRLKLTAVPFAFRAEQLAKTEADNDRGVLGFDTLTANRSILLPDASGTVCLQTAAACGFVVGDSGDFIQNGTSQQSGANFNILASSGVAATVQGASGQNIFVLNQNGGTNVLTVQADGDVAFDTNTLFVDAVNNRVGIGTATPGQALDVVGAADINGRLAVGNFANVASEAGLAVGQTFDNTVDCSDDGNYTNGVDDGCVGIRAGSIAAAPAGTNTSVGGVSAQLATTASSFTITNGYALRALNPSLGAGSTLTNNYGLYVADQTSGTNDYGVYIQDADTYSLFVDAGATRLDGTLELGTLGTANTDGVLCRNSSNQLASCSSTFLTSANAFIQDGNSFGTSPAVLGTNNASNLELETAGVTRLTLDQSGNATLTGNLTVQGTGTSSFGGTLTVADNTTLGDASSDTLTINGTAVSAPNDLNFDSNTLFIDVSANAVGVGTTTPSRQLHIADSGMGGGGLVIGASSTDRMEFFFDGGWAYQTLGENEYIIGHGNGVNTLDHSGRIQASKALLFQAGNYGDSGGFQFRMDNISGLGGTNTLIGGFDNDANFFVDTDTLFVDAANNRLGVGDATPDALFSVGSSSQFQVDTSGNITTAGDIAVNGGDVTSTVALVITTNGTRRATFDTSNNLYLGNGVTAATPNSFTISGTGSSTSGTAGGSLTIQGGNATVGNANGGNLTLTGGAGVGTGVRGLVVIDTPTVTTSSAQNCASTPCAITPANVNSTGAVLINATIVGVTATLPDPTITTAGRLMYVTNVGVNDFTLSVNGGGTGNTIAMKPNTTATMIWNGSDWTAAGASSSTDLQSAYNNTLTSAGGAELVLNAPGGSADGLTIRNNATTPIVGGILEVQSSIGTNLFSVNNLGTELAANGGAETQGGSPTTFPAGTWEAAPAGGTVTRTVTSGQFVTGQAGVQVANSGTNHGVRNNLTGNPVAGTTYTVSFAIKSSVAITGNNLNVQYSRDGGTDLEACSAYSSQNVSDTEWTKITCTILTDGTSASNPDLIIRQGDATSRTIWIDNLSFIRNDSTTQPSNVQIGGGINGGPITLFTLDRATAPPVAAGDSTYLGSMYYDTTTGRIQCYEEDGWGACGSAPDNIVTLTPEYTGAVLNGSGIGTMTADFCSNDTALQVNTSFCASGISRNYYRWTSPQASQQVYSIYVSYKLPNTFKEFQNSNTMKLTWLTDSASGTNGKVTYQVYRSTGSAVTSCDGTNESTEDTPSADTWYTTNFEGDETACGFVGGDYIIFKINVKAEDNANVYVENLDFTYLNQ